MESILNFLESRIEFLLTFKRVIKTKEVYKCMLPVFEKLERDYNKGIVPINENEKTYGYFKNPNNFEQIISTKLGKFLKRHYKNIVPKDHILSEFVATLNAIVWKEPPSIKVHTGQDIIKAYERCKGKNGLDTCMVTGDRPREILIIYAQNPSVVELHCLEDIDGIKARGLVWTLENGDKIVDRIYPNSGENYQKFKAYFKNKKGYFLRKNDKMVDSNHYRVEILKQEDVIVTLCAKDINYYPYLDTFHYGRLADDKLIISNAKLKGMDMQFDDTTGDWSKIDITYDLNNVTEGTIDLNNVTEGTYDLNNVTEGTIDSSSVTDLVNEWASMTITTGSLSG